MAGTAEIANRTPTSARGEHGRTWAATPKLAFTLRGEHLLQPKVTVADWHNRTTDNQNDAYQVFGFPAQPPTLSLELRYRF